MDIMVFSEPYLVAKEDIKDKYKSMYDTAPNIKMLHVFLPYFTYLLVLCFSPPT